MTTELIPASPPDLIAFQHSSELLTDEQFSSVSEPNRRALHLATSIVYSGMLLAACHAIRPGRDLRLTRLKNDSGGDDSMPWSSVGFAEFENTGICPSDSDLFDIKHIRYALHYALSGSGVIHGLKAQAECLGFPDPSAALAAGTRLALPTYDVIQNGPPLPAI